MGVVTDYLNYTLIKLIQSPEKIMVPTQLSSNFIMEVLVQI